MTSNLGAEYLIDNKLDEKQQEEKVLAALKQAFRPEFINRIDDIVVFRKLTKDNIREIAALAINNIGNRLKDRNISLKLTPNAMSWVVENGYDNIYGARPLKRLLKRELENKLAYALLAGDVDDNTEIKVDGSPEGLIFSH